MSEDDWRKIALFLWDRLDDIDTLDDACKSNDAAFRREAYSIQRRRFYVGTLAPDESVVFFTPEPTP